MRIIVGISGASGVIMGYKLVEALKNAGNEVLLVMTKGAKTTWELENELPLAELFSAADRVFDEKDLAAEISSGSFRTDGMVVIPCSMKTLSGIVNGYAENLLLRAADVCMKEGRRLVLVPREMPLGRLHLQNLLKASELGCIIIPPVLTFYNKPLSTDEQIGHIIGKIFMQFGLDFEHFKPWRNGDGENI